MVAWIPAFAGMTTVCFRGNDEQRADTLWLAIRLVHSQP